MPFLFIYIQINLTFLLFVFLIQREALTNHNRIHKQKCVKDLKEEESKINHINLHFSSDFDLTNFIS